jgi:hypothetical protein
MIRLHSLAVILAALLGKVSAAIGPTANLQIVNRIIAPDGFRRSYATCRWCDLIRTLTSAPSIPVPPSLVVLSPAP